MAANWYEEMLKKYPDLKKRVEQLRQSPMNVGIMDSSAPRVEVPQESTDASVPGAQVTAKQFIPAAITREPLLNAVRGMAGMPAQENLALPPKVPQPMDRQLASAEPDELDKVDESEKFPSKSQEDQQDSASEELPDTEVAQPAPQAPPAPDASALAPKEAGMGAPPVPPMQTLDFSGPRAGTVENLQKAHEARNKIEDIANYGKAFDLLGAGIARANPSAQEFYKDFEKQAQQHEKDVKSLMEQEEHDPKSAISKGFRDYIKSFGVDAKDGSAADIKALYPGIYKRYASQVELAAKERMMKETLAANAETKKDIASQQIEGKKEIASMVNSGKEEARAEKAAARETAAAEKKAKEARLSDKQIENVKEFDNSITGMNHIIEEFGRLKKPTGVIQGRVFDELRPDEEVAFRAAVGRMSDMYRHLITGAGAGFQELNRLATRLPKVTDPPSQFIAKAKDVLKEYERTRKLYLGLLKHGQKKDVSELENPGGGEKKVRVRLGNGQVGSIPEANLQALLDRDKGAQVVEE